MYRRLCRALALAGIVALLLVVGPAGLAPGAHAAPVARAEAPHPAASSVTVTPYTCFPFPFPTSDFNTSLDGGRVCFYVTDPVDTSATVTVVDQNATRDGLATPAATFTVNTSSGANASYPNTFYQIPHTLTHGGWWNLSVHGTNGGVANASFFVHTYAVVLEPNAAVYLPGHVAQVNYQIFSTANDAPFENISSVAAVAVYTNTQNTLTSIFPGAVSLNVTPLGVMTLTLPTNIPTFQAVFVTLWANQSGPGVNLSESATTALQVGQLAGPLLRLQDPGCNGLCQTTVLLAGEPAILTVEAAVAGTGGNVAPAAGLDLHLQFRANGQNLSSVPGNPPLNGTLNTSGEMGVVFLANATTFSVTNFNEIVANVSDPLSSSTAAEGYLNFTVLPSSTGQALLGLSLGSTAYYGGDTLTATWAIGGITPAGPAGWQVDHWAISDAINGGILATGLVTTTATAGSFTYAIPVRFAGTLSVNVYAHNATSNLVASQDVLVTAPNILLATSETSYSPGDTLTVAITPLGSVLNGATYFASVRDSQGNSYFDGVLTGTAFSVAIPKAAPPTSLRILVTAQTAAWGVVATATTTVYEMSGLSLVASIASTSQYTDGSFKPGQTIQIHYALTTYGTAVTPKYYWIEVYPTFYGVGQGMLEFTTTSPSGSFSYTIPSGVPAGIQLFEVYATMGGGCSAPPYPCSSAGAFLTVDVNPSPSALDYELGAGSGVTVGWLILLILIVLVAFFVWQMGRRSRRGRAPPTPITPVGYASPPPSSAPVETPADPPAAPPPTSAPSWSESEPAPGGTPPGSPPLPSPGNPPSS
jgi:hypothetical protein